MKNFFFYTVLAALFALPVAASANDHKAAHKAEHKVDCAHKENAEKPECKKHEGH